MIIADSAVTCCCCAIFVFKNSFAAHIDKIIKDLYNIINTSKHRYYLQGENAMRISPYYYGVLKRSIQMILDGSGVTLDRCRVCEENSRGTIEKISYKINWCAKGAVDVDQASIFIMHLKVARSTAKWLNSLHIEVDYLLDAPTKKCVEDDIDTCSHIIFAEDSDKLAALFNNEIPAQEEYQVQSEEIEG